MPALKFRIQQPEEIRKKQEKEKKEKKKTHSVFNIMVASKNKVQFFVPTAAETM